MKKLIIIIIGVILFSIGINVRSQQLPMFSQYVFNNFLYNPAVAGTNNYYQIRSNTRVQWIGIPDHPITNYLSVYGPSANKDMGFGGYLFNDVTGPTSRTGLNGSYAYNIAINEALRLSMGASVGIQQFKIDGSNVELRDEDDAMKSGIYSQVVPDAVLGVYLYAYNYHVGISTMQLLNNKLNFIESDSTSGISKLKTHLYISGGYRYNIDKVWAVEPNMLLKTVKGAPLQMDFTVKGYFRNLISAGFGFRSSDAVTLLLGYIHDKQYFFGYSYDYSFSKIRTFSSGSHEITIGYKFNDLK